MKSFLLNNNVEMYSRHDEGKSLIAQRFIKILEKKIYKYLTSKSKNVYIDKLHDILNTYEKELQNTNQKEFIVQKVTKRKGDELYVKWKDYDNSLASWIAKKDIV